MATSTFRQLTLWNTLPPPRPSPAEPVDKPTERPLRARDFGCFTASELAVLMSSVALPTMPTVPPRRRTRASVREGGVCT